MPLCYINLLLRCRARIVEKLCSLPACAVTTGADDGLRTSGNVICKPFSSLLTASHLSKAANSKSTPYGQNSWRLKVPSDNTSLCPKLFWSSLPSPAFTLIAVISPISQFGVTSGETGKSMRGLENLRWQSWKFESQKWLGKIGQGITVHLKLEGTLKDHQIQFSKRGGGRGEMHIIWHL